MRLINITIDTNTIYLQQYIDIVGIYGQEWPFIKVFMVEKDRLMAEILSENTGEVYSSRSVNILNQLKLIIPVDPIFKNKQFLKLLKNICFSEQYNSLIITPHNKKPTEQKL